MKPASAVPPDAEGASRRQSALEVAQGAVLGVCLGRSHSEAFSLDGQHVIDRQETDHDGGDHQHPGSCEARTGQGAVPRVRVQVALYSPVEAVGGMSWL